MQMQEKRRVIEEKFGRETWVNMDRCANFMARMINKYGKEILEEIDQEQQRKKKEK